ncbi:MAG: DJ-1/PfpI family protein [Candidatus Heimdallarchaeota archaeon]
MPITAHKTEATTIIAQDSDVKILLLLDHEYGGNYIHIREILENQFGWDVTTVALESTVSPCTYHSIYLDVDVTVDNLTQLSSYDCLSIMPGAQVDNLLASQAVMNLINSALSNGLVVSAWCRAVRVLAAADVIDGKNVTGNADYESEYVDAGATFFELSPPIIEAIPSVDGYLIKSNVTDDSGILSVEVKLTSVDENNQRILGGTTYSLDLLDGDENGVFEYDVPLTTGRFTIDIIATDIYMNEITFTDLAILDPSTKNNFWPFMIIALPFIMAVTIKKMKENKK